MFLIGIFGTSIFIEIIKNNQETFEDSMMMNMGQILSIPFMIIGIWLIVRALKNPPVAPFKLNKKTA